MSHEELTTRVVSVITATQHLPRKKDGSINGYALGIAAQNAHRFTVDQLVAGMSATLTISIPGGR